MFVACNTVAALKDEHAFWLQKMGKLAFPIFVAQSSIENEIIANQWPHAQATELKAMLWWLVMETTRVLLGHPSLGDSQLLMETIIGNLGALYKIARIDLTTLKREWEFLNDSVI